MSGLLPPFPRKGRSVYPRPVGHGAYRLDAVLGEGGSATVWSLIDPRGVEVSDRVAKVFEGGLIADALHRELDAYARLHHPSVLLLLDHGRAPSEHIEGLPDGSAFLVLERADATLRRRSVQSWSDLSEVLGALLDALAHAHARGVVHLDVKPSNVVRAKGGWKLADFGVARALRAPDEGRVLVGTPGYMGPEQWSQGLSAAGPWSDLHALGVVAWELATGHRPYGGNTTEALARATAAGSRPPFEPRFPVPRGFPAWVERMLDPEPMARFRVAADARHALTSLIPAPADHRPSQVTEAEAPTTSDVVSPRLVRPMEGSELRVLPDLDPAPPQPTALPTRPISSVGGRATVARRARLGGLPLQGRDDELALAWAALHEVRASRRPAVRFFRGPAGVGTSAILAAFAALCRERGAATVLEARHSPESTTDGVAQAVVAHLRLEDANPWTLTAGLDPTLDAHGFEEPHERRAFVDLVASVLGADMGGMAPDREAALVHFLRRCSARPVVLVLEDLQWGATTLDTIGALASARDLSLLVIGSLQEEALQERPIEASRLARLQPRTHAVRPLHETAMRSWLAPLFELEGEALDDLVRRSQGLPQRALAIGLAAGDANASPEALWLTYVDAVCPTDEDRTGLEAAAALGVDVRPGEHDAVMERLGARLPKDAIDRLAHRGVVQRDRVGWHFAQPAFRRALLERAGAGGRLAELHRACAATLEELYPSPPFGVLERRAHHERAAGNEHDAKRLFLSASVAALDHDTPRQAERLLDEARFEAGSEPPEALLGRARIHRQLGRYDEARAALDELLAGGLGSNLLALHERARVAILTRDAAVERLVAQVRSVLTESEDPFVRGNLLDDLGVEAMYSGQLEEAAERFREAIGVFAELGDRWREGSSRLNLAGVLRRMGDLAGALDIVDDAERTYQQAGSRSGIARVAYVRGDLARMAGDLDDAERCLARGLRFVHSPADRVLLELTVGLVALDRRELDQADVTLAAARTAAERLGMHGVATCARLYEAVGAATGGNWELARSALEDTRSRLKARPYVHDTLVQYGEALVSLALDAGQDAIAEDARALVVEQIG